MQPVPGRECCNSARNKKEAVPGQPQLDPQVLKTCYVLSGEHAEHSKSFRNPIRELWQRNITFRVGK